jgi:NhaP-type Na+/H+ and K+/H+ antiporter
MTVFGMQAQERTRQTQSPVDTFGAFPFAHHVPIGEIAEFYALPIPRTQKATSVGDFIAARLPKRPAIGDAIEIGLIWLVVHDVDRERITRVVLVIT